MRIDHLVAHLARAAATAALCCLLPSPWTVLPALAFFLAGFTFAHDLAHGALRLPARVNHALLSLAGAMMLTSGHAMRVAHLRHHAAPLADDDFEGAAVRVSFVRALVYAPYYAFAVRRAAWRRAPRRDRRVQLVEHVASLLLLLVVGRTYAVTALLLQLAAPVWAGRIPHTAPRWMITVARGLAWTRSPTALSLAFHDQHHAHPAVPTLALATLDRPSCS